MPSVSCDRADLLSALQELEEFLPQKQPQVNEAETGLAYQERQRLLPLVAKVDCHTKILGLSRVSSWFRFAFSSSLNVWQVALQDAQRKCDQVVQIRVTSASSQCNGPAKVIRWLNTRGVCQKMLL